MKDFLKYTLATVVGIFLTGVLFAVISIVSIVSIALSGSSSQTVAKNSVLVIDLSGALEERSEESIKDQLMGMGGTGTMGLDDILASIKKAKANPNVKGIYLEAGALVPDSYASLQAMRRALADFRKSGKWIVAYGDGYTQPAYYVASVADKVLLNPSGMVDWHGIGSQPYFVKDVLAKFGIQMQVVKVGAYKSATEMFTGDKMSDANREQVTAYINGLWQNITSEVSASRKISVAQLNTLADNYVALAPATDLVKNKLVDKLVYADQIRDEIKSLMKLSKDDKFQTLSMKMMQGVEDEDNDEGGEIAVYYAYGEIVDAAPQGISGGAAIVGKETNEALRELADDDDVKAVVIRVNSPGGSAYASEQIWRAVELLKKKKPVVVSMGGLAASGGYYMSAAAQWIVAEPTTLTGSIGIYGMIPNISSLLTDKLGVKFDEVTTNRSSLFGTQARPLNAEEMHQLETYISRGYSLFRQRVADGRHMTTDQVEKIAQGRVWLGQDALKIHLVDQLGSLDDAVAKAAQLAKLKEYHTESYPAKADIFDQLMSEELGGSYIDKQMQAAMGEYYTTFRYLRTLSEQSAIQARLPMELGIK